MTDQDFDASVPKSTTSVAAPAEPIMAATSMSLTPEQMAKLAQMIVNGETEFPEELQASQRDQVVLLVRKLLRDRFVRFIARAIAADLWRASERSGGAKND